MMRKFRKLVNNEKIDLVSYVKDYVTEFPECEILVGCDSQNKRYDTKYAIVVALYKPQKGAHVLYTSFETKKEFDIVSRMLAEVWYSIEIAEALKEADVKVTFIDIDINPDKKFKSNAALTQAVGMVVGMGYKVRYKTLGQMVTYCADHLVK